MVQARIAQASRYNLKEGEHRIEVEPTPRWLRVIFNDVTVADSKRAVLVRETGHLPVYYFPQEDVRMDLLAPSEPHEPAAATRAPRYSSLNVGTRTAENAAWSYPDPTADRAALKGYVAFEWLALDQWMEEEEQIFRHPRDPYHRVDAIQSSRHVRVELAGQTIAETLRPTLVFETAHPVRYYIPAEDVRMDLLEPTDTKSRCPYKGEASYWRPRFGDAPRDIAWAYLDPIAECPKIKGLIAFFNERADAVYVDGELQPKPQTNGA